jgi:hypothetical protein
MNSTTNGNTEAHAKEIVDLFREKARFPIVNYEVKERLESGYLIIYLSNPTERFFKILESILAIVPENNTFRYKTFLKKRPSPPKERLTLPETQLLQTVLSESLTITRKSFEDDFFSHYIPSVFGFEQQITANSNHVIFGRRGAGKSSLLAYAMNVLKNNSFPYAWVAMQAYCNMESSSTILDIIVEIFDQLSTDLNSFTESSSIREEIKALDNKENLSQHDIKKLLPKCRRLLGKVSSLHEKVFIFIDDLHLINLSFQPTLLSNIYSLCRDNNIHLKISAIEQFSKLWNPLTREGLETPHDIQALRLDYNLTIPDKSKEHILGILENHIQYCGLPSFNYISGEGVIDRLIWVAAGIPRDALNIFSQAMTKARLKNQKKVSITSINSAVSVMADEKLRDIERDASEDHIAIINAFGIIKSYCIREIRKNAFLVEIQSHVNEFKIIEQLIALRLLHVLHEGITPSDAGRRYIALMLDYGFYVGIRTARSVDLFYEKPLQIQARELRRLSIFDLNRLHNDKKQSAVD